MESATENKPPFW